MGRNDKTKAYRRHIVASAFDTWYCIKKFTGNQLRSSLHKVKANKCYCVSAEFANIKGRNDMDVVTVPGVISDSTVVVPQAMDVCPMPASINIGSRHRHYRTCTKA